MEGRREGRTASTDDARAIGFTGLLPIEPQGNRPNVVLADHSHGPYAPATDCTHGGATDPVGGLAPAPAAP
jgi:hypothetical protein